MSKMEVEMIRKRMNLHKMKVKTAVQAHSKIQIEVLVVTKNPKKVVRKITKNRMIVKKKRVRKSKKRWMTKKILNVGLLMDKIWKIVAM